ncbi:Peroxiredoxin [Candidatus Lokiarchaeum ossiferum]|uniref:thioredoxin-dependent peroxiredoxin n=1 Tax=Candidatus Lokiarchaeum ossiferum TaxID=2951803 RepID=A0ABY6HLK8_9ARCH|nr:Peroxiredoxin [Candidatus Lokiarchaeum sp. B-35]
MLKIGDFIPEALELNDQDNKTWKLSQLKGKRSILYTYPKDSTPGCTTEAKNFRDSIKEYENADIQIFGISADSVISHKKFAEKHNLPFTLLSDPDKKLLNALGSMEGGKIKRRTWLVDENGKIEKVFEKVSPTNHNAELCEYYMLK